MVSVPSKDNTIIGGLQISISSSGGSGLGPTVKYSKSTNPAQNPEDVPSGYSTNHFDIDPRIKLFIENFTSTTGGSVYKLINELNNRLKGLFREMREQELNNRVEIYLAQYATAMSKAEEMREAAATKKELGLKMADTKFLQGMVQASVGIISTAGMVGVGYKYGVNSDHTTAFSGAQQGIGGLNSGVSSIFDSLIQGDQTIREDVQAQLDATVTELDAKMEFDRQRSGLIQEHMRMLEQFSSALSSMINDLHASHGGTFSAMARTIV